MAKNQRRYAADEPRPPAGRPPRLSGDDMLLIARLHARGRSLRTIAKIVSLASGQDISANTIGRWLRRAQQPQEEVQQALASLRAQAVEGWG